MDHLGNDSVECKTQPKSPSSYPATAPFAKEAEERVINWLTPFFGMQGGHFCTGSTLANLTALWAARDIANVTKVVASEAAHISIAKAAHILGLSYESIPTDAHGVLDPKQLGDLSHTCLVLTAGTTTLGAIDPLHLIGTAAWTHVDAAWAGALRLSPKYALLLEGIEQADSIALSAHKWFFQPKDSALIFSKHFKKPMRHFLLEEDILQRLTLECKAHAVRRLFHCLQHY
jgi:glutamate/tyrosine decarboxylase-like PLP-dependent enzyme